MDLVHAVQIANLCSISWKEVELYKHYISHYMTSFKLLYKLAKVKPIHHAALHYGDVLHGFGPAHIHSTTFYEQYIHSMQNECYDRTACTIQLDLQGLVTRLYLDGLILGAM